MKVLDHNKFRLFDYDNHPNTNFELGDVLIKEDDGPNGEPTIGVVIQTHDDGDCRTDQWGNCSIDEVRLASVKEIKKYARQDVLDNLDLFTEDDKKLKEFEVVVYRISSSFRTITVNAYNRDEARQMAMDEAGDYEYSEKNADYEIDSITRLN